MSTENKLHNRAWEEMFFEQMKGRKMTNARPADSEKVVKIIQKHEKEFLQQILRSKSLHKNEMFLSEDDHATLREMKYSEKEHRVIAKILEEAIKQAVSREITKILNEGPLYSQEDVEVAVIDERANVISVLMRNFHEQYGTARDLSIIEIEAWLSSRLTHWKQLEEEYK